MAGSGGFDALPAELALSDREGEGPFDRRLRPPRPAAWPVMVKSLGAMASEADRATAALRKAMPMPMPQPVLIKTAQALDSQLLRAAQQIEAENAARAARELPPDDREPIVDDTFGRATP
jgi:hypothetical protein